MAKLVSTTYGEALFELAVEENRIDVFSEEISGILEALGDNREFEQFMNHPKILKEDKIQVLENVFKGRISDEITGFLTLLVTKDRYGELKEIFRYFTEEVKRFKKIGTAYVTTAEELSDEQKARIERKLLETTSCLRMEMHYDRDESLIGGMVVKIGDRVVDSSIRTKLNELKRQLLKIQLS